MTRKRQLKYLVYTMRKEGHQNSYVADIVKRGKTAGNLLVNFFTHLCERMAERLKEGNDKE